MIQLVYGINFSIRQISVGESAPPKPSVICPSLAKCVPFCNCFAGSNFHFSLFRLPLMHTTLSLSLSSWRSVFTELPATAGFDQIFNVQLLSLISVWSKLFWSVGVISFQECNTLQDSYYCQSNIIIKILDYSHQRGSGGPIIMQSRTNRRARS